MATIDDPSVFVASIEPLEGPSYLYGYHLGTIEKVARECVVDLYRYKVKDPKGCRTIGLKLDGKLVDVWDGQKWSSEIIEEAQEEMSREAHD